MTKIKIELEKTCGDCGTPQVMTFDHHLHCPKCEPDMFPAGGSRPEPKKVQRKETEVPVEIEEEEGQE